MQTLIHTIFILLLAYLIVDLPPQPRGWFEQKGRGTWVGYVKHGSVHYLSACFLAAIFSFHSIASLRFQSVILGLAAVHVLLDGGKFLMIRAGRATDSIWCFLTDQTLHIVVVVAAGLLLAMPAWGELTVQLAQLRAHDTKILVTLLIYVAVIFGGGQVVRHATKGLLGNEPLIQGETQEELRNAGIYIGWLERFLVLTVLILESPAAVGLILTAKSVVRYPELKSVRFAEYFLIGTLLSITIAVLGGVILLKVVWAAF